MLMNSHDIYELNQVSGILAGGLDRGARTVSGVPPELAMALNVDGEQTRSLPAVVSNPNAAAHSYLPVPAALPTLMDQPYATSG